jgi:hypothetical protein
VDQAAPSQGHEPEAPLPSLSSSPRAHRRRSPPRNSATSPWTVPSQPPLAELSLPLESPASARAKPPSLGPRIGPPAANRRRAHRRPVLLPRSAGSPTPSGRSAVSPPPLLLANGPQRRRHPRAPAPSPLTRGPQLGRKRARARSRPSGPKTLPRPSGGEIPFLFLFFTFFSFN